MIFGRNTVRLVLISIVGAIATFVLYSLVVIATTPNLTPVQAISTTIASNGLFVFALSTAMGVQIALTSYAKRLPCPRTKANAAAGTSMSLSSFFSFFSLVHVGCCGTWLYILSLMPGVIGVGASGFLIQHSNALSIAGLLGVLASTAYTSRTVLRAKRSTARHVVSAR